MIDPQKIIIMTKLAIYDKENAERDLDADRFFRHDFIYRQNMWVRLYVLVGCFILLGFRVLHMLAIDQADLFLLDFRTVLIQLVFILIAIEAAYTVIGTIRFTMEYEKAQKRLRTYYALMDELDPPPPEPDAPDMPPKRRIPAAKPAVPTTPARKPITRKEPEHKHESSSRTTTSMDTRK